MGLSFLQHLSYGGSQMISVGAAAEQGPSIPGARAVRFHAPDGNTGTVVYKGGANASTLDEAATGDSTAAGIGLSQGENSDWLPGQPSDYYFDASAASQNLVIEYLV